MQKEETQTIEKYLQVQVKKGLEKDISDFWEHHSLKGNGEHNRSRRKLIPKSIEVTTERNQSTVTAILSIKLELTQELTPKQIEYILTSHFKRL